MGPVSPLLKLLSCGEQPGTGAGARPGPGQQWGCSHCPHYLQQGQELPTRGWELHPVTQQSDLFILCSNLHSLSSCSVFILNFLS